MLAVRRLEGPEDAEVRVPRLPEQVERERAAEAEDLAKHGERVSLLTLCIYVLRAYTDTFCQIDTT